MLVKCEATLKARVEEMEIWDTALTDRLSAPGISDKKDAWVNARGGAYADDYTQKEEFNSNNLVEQLVMLFLSKPNF